jgi:4-hydroxy-tetrahydrodipicolinate synthase
MVTPFRPDSSLDLDGAARLAAYLVDDLGHDGLIINGTTGESATTSDDEKDALLRCVLQAVGGRATIVAGVGTDSTAHSIHLAKAAEHAGADGLLIVTPYYNRPPQSGLISHFTAIADSTGLPAMTYDIPKRTGTAIETETLVRLAEHPRIVANKDAKGDLDAAQWAMARSGLAWYSGDDILNLPLMSVGAVGFVSVVGHLVGDRLQHMAQAYADGRVDEAARIQRELLPVYTGCFRTQGVIMIKAALSMLGLPAGPVRPPLPDATASERDRLCRDLAEGHVRGFEATA